MPPEAGVPDALRLPRHVLASLVLAVGAVAWFAANIDHPRGPLILLWLPAPLALAIAARAAWRTATARTLPAPTRRFWRQLSAVLVLVGLGVVSQINDSLGGPAASQHMGAVSLTCYGGAIGVLTWAMVRLPLAVSTLGARLRLGLDAGTVVLAAAVFMWHYQTRPLLAQGADLRSSLVGCGIAMVLALVAAFAIAKVILSGSAFVDRGALRLLGLGVILGTVGEIPQTYIRDKPYLLCGQAALPAIAFCAVLAARCQRAVGEANANRSAAAKAVSAERRPYSTLPYLAVAAADLLLLWVTWITHDDEAPVAVGAVALTTLVVLRQLTAFGDNRRLLARLDYSATHDALTNLPNRALFHERLQAALRPGEPRTFCLALIDVDDFKLVNDTLGHAVGDALLVSLAPRLVAAVRPSDTVARLGGDEFVMLLEDVDLDTAEHVVRRLVHRLAAPVPANDHELVVQLSIGLAEGCTGDDPAQLLRRADVAMYSAKAIEGSSVVSFTAGLASGLDVTNIAAELNDAIVGDQLFLLYQPIVTLDGTRLLGAEALVRWNHPTRGVLGPAQFIPVAERTGLIVQLGRWVIRQACEHLAAWSTDPGGGPDVLHVNLSQVQLRDAALADDVAAALADYGVAAERLVLEITETAAMSLESAPATVRALRALGVRIAFDDFGTAQSTLSLLAACPVDMLKLDGSFARCKPTTGRTMAEAILRLGEALGLSIVAEGVETQRQADYLQRLGYRAAQGFLFARPMTATAISGLLRQYESAHQAA